MGLASRGIDLTIRVVRLRWAEAGGYVLGGAGLLAIVCIALFPGIPYDLAMAVMVLALAPVMLGFYELGGRTPLLLARVADAIAIGAIAVFSALMVALAAGLVSFDESKAASGALALLALTMIAFGAVLTGACVLAGAWLSTAPRWLGAVCGIGWLFAGIGLLLGGAENPLTYVGGIGYQLLFPIWGLVIGRRFAGLRRRGAYSPSV